MAALVVSPTRELARQTLEVATPFLAAVAKGGPGPLLLVGGSDPSADVKRFFSVRSGSPCLTTVIMRLTPCLSVCRCCAHSFRKELMY